MSRPVRSRRTLAAYLDDNVTRLDGPTGSAAGIIDSASNIEFPGVFDEDMAHVDPCEGPPFTDEIPSPAYIVIERDANRFAIPFDFQP